MKTTHKSLLKRTVALLLTICSLLAVMVPAVSAEETEGSTVTFEQLTGAVAGDFSFGPMSYAATGEVNGHDYLFLPHIKALFVYDLDTWEKVDSEPIPFNSNTYGSLVDSNGIVWSYGSNNMLHRYDPVTQKGTLTSLMEFDTQVDDAIEVNGKLYLGTYSTARLVEYDPATDTFADLGALSADPAAKRVGTLSYKDGFIYATVNSNTAGKDPHILVKYDLANKKIVETLDFNETDSEYFGDTWNRSSAIVGNTLFISSNNQTKMLAVDISGSKMRIMDPTEMGLPANSQGIHNGISEVIVEPDGNEKIYFMLRQKRENVKEPIAYGWSGWSYLYEYNSKTGLATPVESFPHSANSKEDWVLDYIHTKRGCLVTVGKDITGIEGWEGPSVLTFDKFGEIALFNLASGKVWRDATLMSGDGAGRQVLCITPGPEGSNMLYIGNYMTGYVSAYDLTTGKMTKYDSYSDQVPQIFWYEGKCYATGYGAASLCEVGINQEVKMLFELNKGNNKEYFHQERLHNVTTGDDKLFITTAPCKGYLGGYLSWYDLETKTAYVAVEKDKVLYQKESDRATGTWYDEKTNAPYVLSDTDAVTKEFAGLIADQIPKSIVYQDGYVYGGTGISGGSGSTPAEGASAVLFAYDVANKKLVTLDLRTVLEGFTGDIHNVRSVAADPDVPGKFWAQVAGTLYSFTYDKATETFNLKEELSFSKGNDQDDYYYHMNAWNGAPLYFRDGYIFADLREEGAAVQQMRMICKDDPSYNVLLIESTDRILAFGEDNNFYVTTTADAGIGRFNTASRIAEIIANKAAKDAAQEKINAIGEVTLESEEAIVAARAAYDALPEEVKGLVSNLDVLTAAEEKLSELKAAAEKAAADKAAADAVAAQIEAIGEVTLESEEVIKAARAAYDALTEEQKPLVSNLDALTAAEAKLAQLQAAAEKAAADKAAADAVAAKIEAIGEVTLESEEDIKAARTAYDALTADQKALVSNLDALTAAESKLAEQKAAADKAAADKAAADAAAAKIEDIGEVTLESEEAIKAAREAYDALTAEQKALVSNLDALTAAEAKLAELQAAAADAERIEAARDVVGKALAAMTVTNDTSKEAIQKVIDEAMAKAGITDAEAAVTDVAVTKATTEKAGSAKITVVITSGKGSESSVNTKTIAKLIPPADPDNPQTGDETNLILPVLLMVISVMGIAVGVIFFRKLSYKGKYLK